MKKTLLILLVVGASSVSSQALVLLQDTFPTDGSLIGKTPAVGGTWTVNGANNDPDLVVSAGKLAIQDDGFTGVDALSTFAIQTGNVFYGLTINASALDLATSSGAPFASLYASTGTPGSIIAGLWAVPGAVTGTFRLGISNTGSSTTMVPLETDLSSGIDYRVVVRWTQNGSLDFSTLWLSPASESDPATSTVPAALVAGVDDFGFRQTANSGDFSVDNLIVATTFSEALAIPEPSTFAMLMGGFGMLFGFQRARRSKVS